MASARCGAGTCLYLADIGDNSAKRKEIIIYRVPEPAKAERLRAGRWRLSGVLSRWGARRGGPARRARRHALHRDEGRHRRRGPLSFPAGAARRHDGAARTRRRAAVEGRSRPQDARITDGAISPDGEWVVLRTRTALTFYRAADFLKGDFREARRVDLKPLGEPQGEARRLRAIEQYGVRRRRRRRQVTTWNAGGAVMRQLTPRPLVSRRAIAALAVAACARQVRNVQLTPAAPAVIAELWQAPREPRDLFHGPGGEGARAARTGVHVRRRRHDRLEPRLRRARRQRHGVEREDRARKPNPKS